jgi:glycosyltransferase involved in cell wall biosynthesis
MGTRDIVGPERGALRAPDDEAGFAAQVLRLLGDADLRRAKAAEAREEAQRWSSGAMAGRLVELYEEVLEGAPTIAYAPRISTA